MSKTDQFKKLTTDDIEEWAGTRVYDRGRSYFKRGFVKNVRAGQKGLLAKVSGRKNYITHVYFEGKKSSTLSSRCTCPYGESCKHAVALILTYQDLIENNEKVSQLVTDDPDFIKIEREYGEEDCEVYEDTCDIRTYLQSKTKKELIELVLNIAGEDYKVKQSLSDKIKMARGNSSQIVSSIKNEIASIVSEPAWQNHWDGQGNLADFSRVEKTMNNLLDQRDYNAVLEILNELIEEAIPYIETCDDDGDSASQITSCVEVGLKALEKSDWKDYKKIMMAIEMEEQDDYGIFEGASSIFESIQDTKVWSQVADELSKRIGKITCSGKDDFARDYRRDRSVNYLLIALKKSKRNDEILPLAKREAPLTASWVRYVDLLIESKEYEEAWKASEEGIKQLNCSYPGIIKELREKIAWLAQKKGDHSILLLLRQEDFLGYPSLSSFEILLKASTKTKNKEEMRLWALDYLTKGVAKKAGALKNSYSAEKNEGRFFPMYNVLIDIAEKEKRIDDVYTLYKDATKKKSRLYSYDQVARLIVSKYPDEAITIWKNQAESQINLTKPSAYERALPYLKMVKETYIKNSKLNNWENYFADLKEINKRKTRFIQTVRKL